jgi:hypothetical protein
MKKVITEKKGPRLSVSSVLDPNLRALLDYVAEELAKEYVKLMRESLKQEER